MRRFIDNFGVVLLDMGNTFMFGCDRFGDGADYFATYTALGGTGLTRQAVTVIIDGVFTSMDADIRTLSRCEGLGCVMDYLRQTSEAENLPAIELDLLETVFARHEAGSISQTHADTIRGLRATHPLGLISNILAPSPVFEDEFKRAGVLNLFELRIWSSEHGCFKPSPRLFQKAIAHFGVPAEQMVYVGDNPERDVRGAKAAGMGAVWIRNTERPLPPNGPQPDLVVDDLSELLSV